MIRTRKLDLDRLGGIASSLCAVHCLLTGAAFGLLSVVGLDFLGSLWAEIAFIVVTLIIGTWAMVHGVRKHHSWVPASVFVFGLGCLLVSHFAFGHIHVRHGDHVHHHVHPMATAFSVLGGLCIVAFHVLNKRLAHHCGCDCCR